MIITLLGCQKEQALEEAYIEDILQPYFTAFVEEASIRGIVVDFIQNPVSGSITEELEDGISAQCQHDNDAPNRLLVSRLAWSRSNELQREFLVFHELGHCYLGRSHLDDKDHSGSCISIMHSSSSSCRNNYSLSTRENYLDELFNATIL